MSSASGWITSLSCSSSVVQSSEDTSVSLILHWLRFIFLSPCPQRALLSFVDLLFLLALIVFAVQKLYSKFTASGLSSSDISKPLIRNNRASVRTTLWFKLSLIVTALLALCFTVICILTFSGSTQWPWKLVDALFWLVHAITHAVIAILIVHEKKFEAVTHPLSLRIYWVANFIIVSLFTTSGIIRLVSFETAQFCSLKLDDIVSIVSFPLSTVLLFIAIRGSTGIAVNSDSEPGMDEKTKLYEPLLSKSDVVSGFASASILSKAFWIWMNPLLSKGYKSPLKIDEIPSLSPQHRAERMSELFESKWPKPHEKCKHPVRTTLLRCFWKEVAIHCIPCNCEALCNEANGENKSVEQSNSDKGNSKLIKEEERETGKVGLHVYKIYCTEAYGWWGVVAVLLLSVAWQGSLMAGDYWLSYETSEDHSMSFNPSLFIGVYGSTAVLSMVILVVRAYFVTHVGLKTAQIFFSQILRSILHAPMSFFDTTPSGRILSRASTDQTNIDLFLPFFVGITVAMYITLLGIFIITCQYAWPTIFLVIPLAWANYWYRGYYLSTSRELTRLDSITKAPVIHHFSESISGVMTIRAFGKQTTFYQENVNRVNGNLRMDFHNNGSNEWLGFRLELLGSFTFCLATLFMILLPSNIIKPENVGLSLSYGLSLNGVLFWAIYMSCFVENRMVSVERIKQFTEIPSEAAWKMEDRLPPPNWPAHGNVDLIDLQVRYRSNTPLVLKGITLSIHGGEKIGVVGRTGSGKSTLIQVFFRLVEPSGGRIIIDGIDISLLGLHDLRSRFGIIPQEPVLFEGTVRSNIDPIGQYSDEEIWKSLERCQLKDVVAAKPDKLDSLVADSGDNWSVGQRQLLCLGRVMLKHSRLLFMDEATASVDSQTDAEIQRIIREEFAACTIISIAHRIPTVMDCDRVIVVDAGWAKEFGKPSRLLERPSLFGALVQEYANRSAEL
ncbi:hypothetical protein CUMW_271800 [Citrus unshiu]|uniref:ABC-type xenobiotic transporter n=1 Tax=Citrus unshiu TaxID=55188 RepID=A0A2H5QXR1_CITUN|nr:hypothetical protein CUMW_271800 [Citrus unshiu]